MKRDRQKRMQDIDKRKQDRQKKLMVQFLLVGSMMFGIGVYAGKIYTTAINERVQETLSEQVRKETEEEVVQEEFPKEKEASLSQEPCEEQEEEEKVLPEENLPTDWNLLLVNATHTLPADFQVELGVIGSGHKIDKRAVEDYNAMEWAAKQAGCTVYVVSSYRSMEKQIELHHKKIKEYVRAGYTYQEAQEKAATIVAIPGTSEHQLGLAVDMISADYKKLDQKQETTKGFQWLKEHSWEYGFILRYPNGKTDITGIIYEPWHFRYVGKEVAKEITEQGLTLEEYLGAHPVSAVSEKTETVQALEAIQE